MVPNPPADQMKLLRKDSTGKWLLWAPVIASAIRLLLHDMTKARWRPPGREWPLVLHPVQCTAKGLACPAKDADPHTQGSSRHRGCMPAKWRQPSVRQPFRARLYLYLHRQNFAGRKFLN